MRLRNSKKYIIAAVALVLVVVGVKKGIIPNPLNLLKKQD